MIPTEKGTNVPFATKVTWTGWVARERAVEELRQNDYTKVSIVAVRLQKSQGDF